MTAILAAFDWHFIWANRDELAAGLRNTLEVAALGIAGAFVIGLVLGAARAHRVPVVSQLAAVYVEIIRNTPILVQIFFLFYGLPRISHYFQFSQFAVATLAVMVWGGAFNIENFRAGFEAVPARYREAGLALGFTPLRNFVNVLLPIGGRIALPASINTYVSILKNTAILGPAIGFVELTDVAYSLESVTFKALEVYTVLAATYLVVVWTLSALIRLVEARLALPERA
jgi:His/Glu/Gln/Arg/opine family amino acid ABC transporter permease subunit